MQETAHFLKQSIVEPKSKLYVSNNDLKQDLTETHFEFKSLKSSSLHKEYDSKASSNHFGQGSSSNVKNLNSTGVKCLEDSKSEAFSSLTNVCPWNINSNYK